MKRTLIALACAILLLVSGRAALASTLSGTSITFGGSGSQTSTGISFAGSQNVTTAGTGVLSGFTPSHNTNFVANFTFAGVSGPGGEVLFTEHSDDQSLYTKFTVTSYGYSSTGQLLMYGTLTVYNYTPSKGTGSGVVGSLLSSNSATFAYTQLAGGLQPSTLNNADSAAFSGALTTTPEPNSLILLGTGLVSGAGMLLRRRRRLA